jgi:hypothetical protein
MLVSGEQEHVITSFEMTQDWYVIHAGVDVKNKLLTYKIINTKTNIETYMVVDLSSFPEKLQEKGSLKLFGVNSRLVTGSTNNALNNKTANGQYHHFYLNIDKGYDETTLTNFLKKVAKPATPKCNDNCELCVGVDSENKHRNVCAKCATNYIINNNDQCIIETDIFDYGYYSLVDKHLRGPNVFDIKDECFLANYRATVGFYIRKNYHPDHASVLQNFLSWGQFKIGIKSTESTDSIVFTVGTKTLTLEHFEGDGSWNYLSFRLTENKLTGQIIGRRGEIIAQETMEFTSFTKVNEVKVDILDSMIDIYSLNYFATSYLGAKLVNAPTKECSIDCVKCTDNGFCKLCQTGQTAQETTFGLADGSCPIKPIRFFNTRVDSTHVPDHFPLNDYINTNNVYRSRKFSFTHTYKPNKTSTGKHVVFRLNNIDHSSSITNGVANNYLVLLFQAPNTFYVRYHNRNLLSQSSGAPKEYVITLSGAAENPEFFIGITFDGDRNRFGGVIYNSQKSWDKFGFTSIGEMGFLTNHAYLHLSDAGSAPAEYRHINFYYEHVLPLDTLWEMALKNSGHIQNDCKYGSIRQCEECRTGVLENYHCKVNASTQLEYGLNRVHHVLTPTQIASTFTGTKLSSFTNSFWYRRTNTITNNPIVLVAANVSGGKQIYKLVVDKNTLIGIGYANEKPNRVVLSNLIDHNESEMEWVYITVKYDFISNKNTIETYIERTKRKNFANNRGNTGFEFAIDAPIEFALGSVDAELNTVANNYDITSFTFNPNYLVTQPETKRFRTVSPRACTTPCSEDCSIDHICPLNKRLTSTIVISNKYDETTNTDVTTLPAFQTMRDVVPQFDSNPELNTFMVSLQINIKDWIAGETTQANNNILAVISNDSEIRNFHRGDVITPTIVEGAILSIIHRDEKIVFISGSNAIESIVEKEFIFGNLPLTAYNRVFVAVIMNFISNEMLINMFIDDLQVVTNNTISLSNTPDVVTSTTGFYTHNTIREIRCNLWDPRFEQSGIREYLETATVTPTNLCNQDGATGCSKCVSLPTEAKVTCTQCDSGYRNILGRCLPQKVCTAWKTLEEYYDSIGTHHGAMDKDDDADEEPASLIQKEKSKRHSK